MTIPSRKKRKGTRGAGNALQSWIIGVVIVLAIVGMLSINRIVDSFRAASEKKMRQDAGRAYADARETLKRLGVSTYSMQEATGQRVLDDDPTLRALLSSAIDESSRRRLAEHIVYKGGCRYCDAQTLTLDDNKDFQKWYDSSQALLLYDAIKHWPAYSNWTQSFFQSTDVGESNLKILVDEDDMAYVKELQATQNFVDSENQIEEQGEKMPLREFVKKCVDGDAPHRFLFHPIAGGNGNFQEWNDAWFPTFADDTGVLNAHPQTLLTLALNGYDGIQSAERYNHIKKLYPRLMNSKGKGRKAVQAAIDNINHFSSAIVSDEGSKNLPNVLMGQHKSGLFWHQHKVSTSIAVHGYRLWMFMYAKIEDVQRLMHSTLAGIELDFYGTPVPNEVGYFTRYPKQLQKPSSWDVFLSNYNYTKGFKLCCQPPGSVFYLPKHAGHSTIAWAEAEGRTGPAPIDQKGGFTLSLAYQ